MASIQMKLDSTQDHNNGSKSSSNSLDNLPLLPPSPCPPIIANVLAAGNINNNSIGSSSNSSSHIASRSIRPTCNSTAGHSKIERTISINSDFNNNTTNDFHTSNANHLQLMTIDMPMRRLKKMGWYWGSISPEYAAKLLEDEQDGTFLVRDSSSECYIFSMTFKLEGQIHHSRIEHCKGQFSFGRSPKFRCTTIVDFIEQAIAFSHNEELLFFLHRDPSMEGPARFRMIPLSRLKGMTSLKHMCRFAILPYVRRDRISELSIPECLREYLYEPFYQTT